MADPEANRQSKFSVEERLFHLECRDRAKTVQIEQLESDVKELQKLRGVPTSGASIVIRSAVWEEFTTEFWQHSLVKLDEEGNLSRDVEWTMRVLVLAVGTDSILEEMCAKRLTFKMEDWDENGEERLTDYYYLAFKKKKDGAIPTEWAAYSSWKFALKVKYFLNLTVEQRLKAIATNSAYHMFKDSGSVLYGRLKMLAGHIYEIHKLTWTRMRANKDSKGAKVGPTTMTVVDMIAIQTPFMQNFLNDLAKRSCLKNRHLYSEHTAATALACLLRNFKDTDRYVDRDTHGVGLPKFGTGKKKVKISAPVPLPFENGEDDAEQKTPKRNRKRKCEEDEGGQSEATGSKQKKAKQTFGKKHSLKLLATKNLPTLKLKLRAPHKEDRKGKKKSSASVGQMTQLDVQPVEQLQDKDHQQAELKHIHKRKRVSLQMKGKQRKEHGKQEKYETRKTAEAVEGDKTRKSDSSNELSSTSDSNSSSSTIDDEGEGDEGEYTMGTDFEKSPSPNTLANCFL